MILPLLTGSVSAYRKNSTPKRTLFLPGVDLQAAPPAGWCIRCGAEVYRRGKALCRRCERRGLYGC